MAEQREGEVHVGGDLKYAVSVRDDPDIPGPVFSPLTLEEAMELIKTMVKYGKDVDVTVWQMSEEVATEE